MDKHSLFVQVKKYSDRLHRSRAKQYDKNGGIVDQIFAFGKKLRKEGVLDAEDERLVSYLENDAKRFRDDPRGCRDSPPDNSSEGDGSWPAWGEHLKDCPMDAKKWFESLHS